MMNMSKVGNQTNSNDPQAINSRVFVGNLNTYQVAKEDVERMFKRYGRVVAISMHKGYAFVQYSNPYEARCAVQGEDGAVVCGQVLDLNIGHNQSKPHAQGQSYDSSYPPGNSRDSYYGVASNVNMVTEPKSHQTGRKRQNVGNTGNDWDYYYDSYAMSSGSQRMTPPTKKARMGGTGSQQRQKGKAAGKAEKQLQSIPYNQLNSYNSSDILICGNCKDNFSSLQKLAEHKKAKCKLRFTCKCQSATDEPSGLLCANCKEKFNNAWDLLVHLQTTHHMPLYEEADEKKDSVKKADMTNDSNNVGTHGDGEQEVVDEDALLQDDAEYTHNS